jgi:hypothetical protein
MGKKSTPAPPDYTPLAQASQAQTAAAASASAWQEGAAQKQLSDQETQSQRDYDLQQQQFQWAKDTYGQNLDQNQQVIDQDIATQKASADNAAKAQARYEQVYQPLEDQAVNDAETYDSPGRRDAAVGGASADVAQASDSQRLAAAQNLESFGVDPSSTRYAALDAGIRANGAAAQAGAANQAGRQVDATAQALRANAINVGRGLPSDVNASNSTAINAGQTAVNSTLATTGSGANTMGTGVQYGSLGLGASGGATQAIGSGNGAFAAGTGAINAWGNTLNNGFNNQMSAYNAKQSASSGIGGLLGTVAGLDSSSVGGAALMKAFSKGGAVPDMGHAIPAGHGRAVPASASPSGGRAVDDVPARLTPGEFVVPKDVVAWHGEKHFQHLITKTREDRVKNSPAQPRVMAVAAPAFTRPSALPVR